MKSDLNVQIQQVQDDKKELKNEMREMKGKTEKNLKEHVKNQLSSLEAKLDDRHVDKNDNIIQVVCQDR